MERLIPLRGHVSILDGARCDLAALSGKAGVINPGEFPYGEFPGFEVELGP